MMDKRLIAQKFIVGFEGTSLTDDIKHLYKRFPFGGIILFQRNIVEPKQIFELVKSFQDMSKDVPLFVAIDHEGGRVFRMKEPFTQIPPAGYIGKYYKNTNDSKPAKLRAKIFANELKTCGFNLNFDPVTDIFTNKENKVIGDRAFSDDEKIVSFLTRETILSYKNENIFCCAKHFPGHGDTKEDSHLELPVLTHDISRLVERELQPFQAAVKADVDFIMTAHIKYPNIDPNHPATLSSKIMVELLRNKLKYNGILITDDMNMKAIANNYSVPDWTMLATKASADIILVCRNYDVEFASYEALVKEISDKKIDEGLINNSVDKILKLKKLIKLPSEFKPENIGKIKFDYKL